MSSGQVLNALGNSKKPINHLCVDVVKLTSPQMTIVSSLVHLGGVG